MIGGALLSLHALATGTVVALPDGPGSRPIQAAFSPDGRRIATLDIVEHRTLDDYVDSRTVVTVLDIDGGGIRELWSAEGGTSSDTVVSFSPDGRFLGVTYVDDEDSDHTVVLDNDGAVVADLPQLAIVGQAGLSWTGEHQLVAMDEYTEQRPAPIVLIDAATGDRQEIADRRPIGVLGSLDGRLVRPDGAERIVTTAFDGSDLRPLVDAGPGRAIRFFDAVPGALHINTSRPS